MKRSFSFSLSPSFSRYLSLSHTHSFTLSLYFLSCFFLSRFTLPLSYSSLPFLSLSFFLLSLSLRSFAVHYFHHLSHTHYLSFQILSFSLSLFLCENPARCEFEVFIGRTGAFKQLLFEISALRNWNKITISVGIGP